MSAKKNRLKARLRNEQRRRANIEIESANRIEQLEHSNNVLRSRLDSFVNVCRIDSDRILRFEFNLSELELQHASMHREDYARMVTEHAIRQFEKRMP